MRGREETLMLDFSLAKMEEKRKKKAMIAQTKLKMFRFNGRTYWVKIDIEEFSARHGATKDLGDHATSKDFFNLFIDDDYLEEIVRCTIACTCSKGDETFTTSHAEISAYIGLNIYMGIHSLGFFFFYWHGRFQGNDPQAALQNSGQILTFVRPK